MLKLTRTIAALDDANLKKILKDEIQNIDPVLLPLQQGLSLSSYVGKHPFSATILKLSENDNSIIVKAGIFYTGIIAGCSCADDPTPIDEQNEYCELLFTINKDSTEATVALIEE